MLIAPASADQSHLGPGRAAAALAPERSPAPTITAERDALIDNARFVLIVLVVLGHFLTTMRTWPATDILYSWIYMFHMPAFAFLAGLVLNAEAVSARQGGRIVTGLLAPLVSFTLVYQAFGTLIGEPVPTDTGLMVPYWVLWFLVALTIWRLLVPVLRSLRWPVATTLVVATVLALVADLPPEWSIDRVIVLLPFFTAGLVLNRTRLQVLRSRTSRLVGVGVLVVSAPVSVWVAQLPDDFRFFSDAVESMSDVPAFLGMYAIAAAMTAAVLALTPSSRSAITTWGARTIYVYLLHGLFVRGFRAVDAAEVLMTPIGFVVVLAASIGLAIFLSSDLVVRRTRRLVEPRLTWLLRQESTHVESATAALGGSAAPRSSAPVPDAAQSERPAVGLLREVPRRPPSGADRPLGRGAPSPSTAERAQAGPCGVPAGMGDMG
jgi:fucose 4-O-acetylase-like acetyltransferase